MSNTLIGATLETKIERLVIFSSTDEVAWSMVLPANVPEWLKDDDVLRNLVDGHAACREGTTPRGEGDTWFRAEVVGLDEEGNYTSRPPGETH